MNFTGHTGTFEIHMDNGVISENLLRLCVMVTGKKFCSNFLDTLELLLDSPFHQRLLHRAGLWDYASRLVSPAYWGVRLEIILSLDQPAPQVRHL